MTQQYDNNTAPKSSSGDGAAQSATMTNSLAASDSSTSDSSASDSAAPVSNPRGRGLLTTVMWGGVFVMTAIASTAVGVVLGFAIPSPDTPAEQEQTTSITDLWRKGVRHQLIRPVNILVMGIDQVPPTDLPSSSGAESVDQTVAPIDQTMAERTSDVRRATARNNESTPDQPSTFSLDSEPTSEPISDSSSEQTAELDRLAGRSDAMLLVQLDPDTNTVNVLSIPRDTQVQFPDQVGVTKINHANLVGGPRLAAAVVSHNLGDVEIDRYVRISTAAFRELVDAVGGVEVSVPAPMKYTDQTQGLYIDLEAGKQVLTGDEAEQFARFRGDIFGDIGRVQRQQQLLRALRDRLISPNILSRIPGIVQLLRSHIDTNLTPEEFLAILNFALEMDQDGLRMVMLPGTFSQQEYLASYWLMDRPAVNQVLEDYFQVEPSQLVAQADLDQTLDQSIDRLALDDEDRDRALESLKSLRIAVQNASSDPSAPGKLIRYLQSEGFTQVYRVTSLDETQLDTQIIVQRGNLRAAELVEQTLEQGSIVSASIGDLSSDLTIRIGNDWHLLGRDK